MSVLMVTTAIAVVYGLISGRYERALAVGAVTPAGAAFVAGGEALPTFYATAAGGAVLLAGQWLVRRGRPGSPPWGRIPGVGLLLIMLAWAVVVVVVAPFIAPGARTVTDPAWLLVPGRWEISNVAQLLYLALSVVVVIVVARSTTTTTSLLAIPLAAGVLLSLWRYLSIHAGVPFPEGVFANSPAFRYIEQAPGGVPRFRGIHSEPSALASTSMIAVAYFTSFAVRVRGLARVGSFAMVAGAMFLGLVSTSTTFLVAGAVVGGCAFVALVVRLVTLRLRVSVLTVCVALAVAAAAIFVTPDLIDAFTSEVDEKLGSDSYDDRSDADALAFEAYLETWGWGMGLGSVRASSLIFTLLGAVGTIGTLLFVGAVATTVLSAARISSCAPVIWALTAALVVKVVSSPDLSDTSGVVWLGLGILARAVVADREGVPMPVMWPRRTRGAPQDASGPAREPVA